jgi:hypothetical protein
LAGTVTGTGSNVMMSHKEPYEAGMSCDFCHGRTGHEGATSPQMSSCSECHDGVRASTVPREQPVRPVDPRYATGVSRQARIPSGTPRRQSMLRVPQTGTMRLVSPSSRAPHGCIRERSARLLRRMGPQEELHDVSYDDVVPAVPPVLRRRPL